MKKSRKMKSLGIKFIKISLESLCFSNLFKIFKWVRAKQNILMMLGGSLL